MIDNRLEIGKIVNTHGLRGEVKVTPWCDDPEIFQQIESLYDKGNNRYDISGVKYHKGCVVLSFKSVNDINSAELLKNKILYVERETLGELPEGVHYIKDLIGLSVYEESGTHLGILIDCLFTGSNDVYVVKPKKGKDILLPAIPQVVKQVDLSEKKMVITLIEGLIEE